jgi:hypothetical protein
VSGLGNAGGIPTLSDEPMNLFRGPGDQQGPWRTWP